MTTQSLAPDLAVEGLRASAPHTLPFAPSLEIRAFALQREQGDVLVYSAPAAGRLGPVARWYLNHRHEAMFAPDQPVDAPLLVHEAERASVERALHVRAAFSRRHHADDDLEVVPIPGHTPGASALLWDSGRHRFLFTGDTVSLDDGEWVAAVLPSSDRTAYLESLDLLRGLDFDVLVPWAATAGQPWYALTDRADANRRLGEIIDRVWRGGDR